MTLTTCILVYTLRTDKGPMEFRSQVGMAGPPRRGELIEAPPFAFRVEEVVHKLTDTGSEVLMYCTVEKAPGDPGDIKASAAFERFPKTRCDDEQIQKMQGKPVTLADHPNPFGAQVVSDFRPRCGATNIETGKRCGKHLGHGGPCE